VDSAGRKGFTTTEVLSDNQADISIVQPELQRALPLINDTVKVRGVGGVRLELDQVGYLQDFFEVYSSSEARVNILIFTEVEEVCPITYVPQEGFVVHMDDRDILFKRCGKMHVADFAEFTVIATQAYTKGEIARAKQVMELVHTCGYPSYTELGYMLREGKIMNILNLAMEDIRRAYELYGKTPEFVRGRMTHKKASRAIIEDDLVLADKRLTLYTDVMHIEGQRFLVTVCDPLQLTLQVCVERESQNVLGPNLQGQIDLLRSKGFSPVRVYVEPQSALKTLATKFEGVSVDVGGAGDFVPKVDAKISRIKERFRSVKAGLKWKIPPVLVKDLVAYVVTCINSERSVAINLNVAPKVLFTGMRMDFKKEFCLAFGDYCKVYDGTDNTARARSIPCIALYPCNNATGSWAFWNLNSMQRIRRT
jgi:hypothetical protein